MVPMNAGELRLSSNPTIGLRSTARGLEFDPKILCIRKGSFCFSLRLGAIQVLGGRRGLDGQEAWGRRRHAAAAVVARFGNRVMHSQKVI